MTSQMTASQTMKMLLTPAEAAKTLSISPASLWRLTAPRGPIRSVRIGAGKKPLVRYAVADLQAFIGGRETESQTDRS